MAISGTVPVYDLSTSRLGSETQVLATVTGAVADGQAINATSNETTQEFLQRAVNILAISGTLSGTFQAITPATLSGVMQLQRECAFRLADLTNGGEGNAARLTAARTALAVSGEVQFGA